MRYLYAIPLVLLLAGCTATATTATTDPATSDPAPTVTQTVTAPASSAPASSPPATAPSEPGGCRTSDLKGTLADAGGGAAGSTYVGIVLTNVGTSTCFLQGWPGVSIVGHGDGTQIGAAAEQDRSGTHAAVTLQTGQAAQAVLQVAEAGDYSVARCDPTPADGFRVYPPGEKASLYIADKGLTGCAMSSVSLLTVKALQVSRVP